MVSKNQMFSTVTMPNDFWQVIIQCVKNTDEISLRKFIIESEKNSSFSERLTEEKFLEMFEEFVKNYRNEILCS